MTTNPEALRLAREVVSYGSGMTDQIECSCGWKSQAYFDGREWADQEWSDHLRQSEKDNSDADQGEGTTP